LEQPESAIIFVRTRKAAAELTNHLQGAGHSVDEYHGDLTQTQRERLLMRFRQDKVRWIVATDIAARGLDVDHLTHVINYDLPDSVENYIHRIGRTGRAGKEGTAISLIHSMDRRKLQMIERRVRQSLQICNIPTRAQIEARHLEKIQAQVQEALTGERVASFLPLVSQLNEQFDIHTIAAAAIQMVYDQTRPAWLDMEEPVIDNRPTPKPRVNRSGKPSVRGEGERGSYNRSNYRANSGGYHRGNDRHHENYDTPRSYRRDRSQETV
jgi:ATP-dependent RNA helicase DeaD